MLLLSSTVVVVFVCLLFCVFLCVYLFVFFLNGHFKNIFKDQYQSQTVWIQIRTDVMLVQICVQTVCKGNQQTKSKGSVKQF